MEAEGGDDDTSSGWDDEEAEACGNFEIVAGVSKI